MLLSPVACRAGSVIKEMVLLKTSTSRVVLPFHKTSIFHLPGFVWHDIVATPAPFHGSRVGSLHNHRNGINEEIHNYVDPSIS